MSMALFEFWAGRVDFNPETGEATPLSGQGRVALLNSSEDPSLLGLQWFPRGNNTSATAGEELLLVPGDAEFSHVPECQTGRVVQMQFRSSGERHMFWLQEAPAGDLQELSEKDRETIARLNELASEYRDEDPDEGNVDEEDAEADMAVEESHVQQNSEAQTSPTDKETADATPPANITSSSQQEQFAAGLRSRLRAARSQQPLLSSLFGTNQRAMHVTSAHDEALDRLLKHTEGVANNREELLEVVSSPHFANALDSLGQAVLESPALAQELGLSRMPTTVEEFLEELRKLREREE